MYGDRKLKSTSQEGRKEPETKLEIVSYGLKGSALKESCVSSKYEEQITGS